MSEQKKSRLSKEWKLVFTEWFLTNTLYSIFDTPNFDEISILNGYALHYNYNKRMQQYPFCSMYLNEYTFLQNPKNTKGLEKCKNLCMVILNPTIVDFKDFLPSKNTLKSLTFAFVEKFINIEVLTEFPYLDSIELNLCLNKEDEVMLNEFVLSKTTIKIYQTLGNIYPDFD